MDETTEQKKVNSPRDMGATTKRLLSYLAPHKKRLIVVVFLIIISTLVQIACIYALKPMLNDYIIPFIGQNNPNLSGLIGLITIVAVLYGIRVVAEFFKAKLMVPVSTGVLYDIRVELFSHMGKLPIVFFDSNSHGELMSRFTNDTDALREMFSTSLTEILSSGMSAIGIYIAMIILSWQLSILVTIMLVVMVLILKYVGRQSGHYFANQQKSIGEVNGFLEEMIEGQNVIKVFNREGMAKEEFSEINDELRKNAQGAATFSNLFMPIMMTLGYVNYALTAMVGVLISIKTGALDIGTIAAFLQYTRNFNQPISQVSQQLNSILRALAGAERIFELLDSKPEIDDGQVTLVHVGEEDGRLVEVDHPTGLWAWRMEQADGSVLLAQLKGEITFDDVSFGYTPDEPVLKHINMRAKSGQKIALVGSTGAGKTTITNLLNRFYDVAEGAIYYDGINLLDIRKSDLRRSLAMVLQDTHLFTGTVNDNIRYGNLTATNRNIVEASRLANADSFIETLPHRYETVLTGSGENLSQGQRQLLSIARAAVANPPVLILDEATSSIDTRTEKEISEGMDQLMKGRTSFVIAHRLSTIRDSDVILVMEHGEIIEQGSHDELLKEEGRYYQLYTGAIELS